MTPPDRTDHRNGQAWPAAGLGVCLLLLVGCADGAPSPALAAPHQPNVIFLTVDTLRADHLKSYGYARDTMPAIDAFMDTALVFDNAVVPRGSTRPSYTSMLTGLYPFHHGVRNNNIVANEELLTLPEILRDNGYFTAGFVSNFILLGEFSGLDQGFDLYDDYLAEREGERETYERTAPRTLQAILDWLDSGPPEPFFLFTNFIDPHGPYRPPASYRALFRSQGSRILRPDEVPAYQSYEGSLDFFDYVDRYDAEIRYTDAALGLLIEKLKVRGVWDDSIVVFCADHGESMGEHKVFFEHHPHVWEETTRVPFAIRLPVGSGLPEGDLGRRRSAVVSPMDLMPTVIDLLGLRTKTGLDGRSLLPLWGGGVDWRRFLLVEFPDEATPGRTHPDIYALRGATHKLIRALEPGTGRIMQEYVFNVGRDPLEQHGVRYDATLPLHRELSDQLDAILGRLEAYQVPFQLTEYQMPYSDREEFVRRRNLERNIKELDEDQVEALRALGYVK